MIYELTIARFRGIKSLSWQPARGVNLVLGGGDVGKSTILDAIALLLSPTNAANLADTDYFLRNVADEFVIEAIMSLPTDGAINHQVRPSWPWAWNGSEAVVPNIEGKETNASEAVYRIRVRGTADLELAFEIVQPDGTADHLSVGLRRSIGLVRLAGDDRSDRDLRLVQGSALDRLLSDKSLRSRIASALSTTDVQDHLASEAKTALRELDKVFEERRLPSGLDISITGGPGTSIASLIGLRAGNTGIQLPISAWGAGTRRLAALTIAEQNQGEHPVVLVDEVERGLEPYRQRILLEELQAGQSQVFVTTHSPSAISAAREAALWYVDHVQTIGPLSAAKTATHRVKDPEMFLARLAIVCEGITEVGFVTALLEAAVGASLQQHGVHVSNGEGNDPTLNLLEALAEGGLRFGGFADDEGTHPTRWASVMAAHGPLVFRWGSGCIEENILRAVPEDRLEAFLIDPDGEETGARLRTLADRMGTGDEKAFVTLQKKAGTELRAVIAAAATGDVPAIVVEREAKKAHKAHARCWFKSDKGGRELATKMFELGCWSGLRGELLPFCNAARRAVGLDEVLDVHL
ncbi:MAG: ATP-dependent nuclease [Gemmatimonadaceae bacterium]